MKLELVELASKQDGQTSQQCELQTSRKESMKLELVELASKQDGQTGQQCEFELDGPKGTNTVQTRNSNSTDQEGQTQSARQQGEQVGKKA